MNEQDFFERIDQMRFGMRLNKHGFDQLNALFVLKYYSGLPIESLINLQRKHFTASTASLILTVKKKRLLFSIAEYPFLKPVWDFCMPDKKEYRWAFEFVFDCFRQPSINKVALASKTIKSYPRNARRVYSYLKTYFGCGERGLIRSSCPPLPSCPPCP